MLIIRNAQIRAVAAAELPALVKRVSARVAVDYPAQAQGLGQVALKEAVDEGVTTALRYGLDDEQDLVTYVYLMFTFGRHFDTDAGYPWAALHVAQMADDESAMSRLIRAAAEFEHLGRGLMSNSRGKLD